MGAPTMQLRQVAKRKPQPKGKATTDATPRRHSRLRYIPYLLVAGGAVYGQIQAGLMHRQPEDVMSAVPIYALAFAIEGGAVWMAWLAKERGERGESVKPFFIASTFFALIACGINIIGHWGDIWSLVVFGLLSAGGYAIWCIDLNALLDDTWDPDGSIRKQVPSVRVLAKMTTDADLVRRARRLALLYAEAHRNCLGLGPSEAIDMAISERAEEQQRAKLAAAVKQHFQEQGLTSTDVNLAILANGSDRIVQALMDAVDTDETAKALAARIAANRLAGAVPSAIPAGATGQPVRPGRRREKAPDRPADQPTGGGADKAPEAKAPNRVPRPSADEFSADPYVLYGDQLKAVIAAIPDWETRTAKISGSEVLRAQDAAYNAGTLLTALRSKPYCLRFAWMLEAISRRRDQIPPELWGGGKPLADVDPSTLDGHRERFRSSLVRA